MPSVKVKKKKRSKRMEDHYKDASKMSEEEILEVLTAEDGPNLEEEVKVAYNKALHDMQSLNRTGDAIHDKLKFKEGDEPVKHAEIEHTSSTRGMISAMMKKIDALPEAIGTAIGNALKEAKE